MTQEPERIWQTRTLLESYLDYLPGQYRSSLQTTSGPVPSRRSPCKTCQGQGRVLGGQKERYCPACDGTGWATRQPGEPYYDLYTSTEVATEDSPGPLRVSSLHELDLKLAQLERQLAEREGRVAEGDELVWLRRKRAMRRAGSYAALERALLWLRMKHPYHFRYVWNCTVLGWALPHPDREQIVREGIAKLADQMPEEIRVPPWYTPDPQARKRSLHQGKSPRHRQARGERNKEIRSRYLQGESTTKLAIEYNLSRRSIQQITNGLVHYRPTGGAIIPPDAAA